MSREFIEIDGCRLAYKKSGSGSPIILMHGWGCNADTLDSVARIAEQYHTVYNVDFPGFGQSPEPDQVWGVEAYTALIEKMADRLGLENPALLGHSFGGRVGLLYASRRPVSKLILVDAAGVKPTRPLSYYIKVYSFKAMKHAMRLLYGREGAEKRLEAQRAKRGSADYAAASPKMRAILSKVVNEDLCHVMPNIKASTLLIYGENDTATPVSDARKIERLVPDAGLAVMKGCGHYSFLDNPAQFAAILHSFLKA